MTEATDENPVIVAGAGPVGMSAALALHARNVPVTVFEADPEDRDRPGSRAIYLHGATLHTWERVHPGLGEQISDAGLLWDTRRTLWRGKEVFSRTYDNPGGRGKFPHFTSVPQVTTEDLLLDAVDEAGIDIHWDTAVEQVDSRPDGVTVTTDDGDEYEAPYVVGADGGGSTVRKEIGSEFEGEQSENAFIIADVDEVEDEAERLPMERLFHYEDPDVGNRNVLLVPFQGGWRLDIQCFDDEDPEEVTTDEKMREFVEAVMGEQYADNVDWVSTYYFKQVIADSFVDENDRVLLVGEAAHLLAPFGARGMNSGVADADEAASAIAVADRARTDGVRSAEVEVYGKRREIAAEYNVGAAGEALDHLRGDNPATILRKEAAASLADYFEVAGEWLDDAPYGPHDSPPIVSLGQY
ncbi:MAG: FAD-dependent monooxygenase [Halarchaeum sp.]